jgi:hypothetical protein
MPADHQGLMCVGNQLHHLNHSPLIPSYCPPLRQSSQYSQQCMSQFQLRCSGWPRAYTSRYDTTRHSIGSVLFPNMRHSALQKGADQAPTFDTVSPPTSPHAFSPLASARFADRILPCACALGLHSPTLPSRLRLTRRSCTRMSIASHR